ncbi:uncharacterized protein LOC117908888 isoform X3 [Vitis riparia]|uniref:uncharacterized protein LOC117908888 isoform X3 n=1 Tax=Vitis riparia TaxID=96939 RepID=UPI00155A8D2B|nr:uncharacterized protein LOC117908888 isoform X3 [Vitis riparia]
MSQMTKICFNVCGCMYYNIDAYYRPKMEREVKKGSKKALETERTVFNDEEQQWLELLRERERYKEEQVEELKHSMQSGMFSFYFNIPPGSCYNYILLLALEVWLNGKGLEWVYGRFRFKFQC